MERPTSGARNITIRQLHQEGIQSAVQRGDEVAADIHRVGIFALDFQELVAKESSRLRRIPVTRRPVGKVPPSMLEDIPMRPREDK